ncbi:MAG: hypothetical protein R6V67_03965, partial [Spirochaetia bacterium]
MSSTNSQGSTGSADKKKDPSFSADHSSADHSSAADPPFLRLFTQENTKLTGVRICRARSGQQRRLMQIENRVGYTVSKGEVGQWRWKGTIEAEGFLYASFPESPPIEPLCELSDKDPETALGLAESFFYSYSILRSLNEKAAAEVSPEAVFFDTHGNWYFLPPSLSSIIGEGIELEYKGHLVFEGDPEKKVTGAVLFYLYKAFTGHGPNDEEKTCAAHPHLYTPELTEECAALIFSPFSEGNIPSTAEASRLISKCRRGRWKQDLGSDERQRRMEAAGETLRREAKHRRIKTMIRRYSPPIALGAAAVFVLLFLFFPFDRNTDSDPTEGLAPEEVIRLYYNSVSELDHETMDKCTTGGRSFPYMKEVTNLFVITRVRQGVEHAESFMTAEEWLEKGRPPLSNHMFVYGISDLDIIDREVVEKEEERGYTVKFNKYSTSPVEEEGEEEEEEEEGASTGIVEIQEITESLTL